jgi:hypothetical protein
MAAENGFSCHTIGDGHFFVATSFLSLILWQLKRVLVAIQQLGLFGW